MPANTAEQNATKPVVPPAFVTPPAIGSKVTFTAADGKVYTGTVQSVMGDQFKIKYDGFNFDTWLSQKDFTAIPSSVNVPSATIFQSGNQQPVFTNTSGSPSFLSIPGFWGSLLIIIGFFTNWINFGPFGGVSGFRILTSARELIEEKEESGYKGILTLIFIVILILSALICLLHTLGAGIGRRTFSFFKLLPLLISITAIVMIIWDAQKNYYVAIEDYFTIIGAGAYLTLAGSVILALSRSKRK
ncbi:MAG: hypothetical protein WDN26_11470 [Chitinophagaceae bacterium]